ncbi:MAG: Mitochondrial ribosome subunit S26 [Marteilia pararefringens]
MGSQKASPATQNWQATSYFAQRLETMVYRDLSQGNVRLFLHLSLKFFQRKELEQFYERLHEIPLSRSDCTESQPNFEQIDQWNRSVSTLIKEQIATEKANELSNLSRYKANYEKAVEIEQFYQKSFEEMLANRNLFITEENFDEKYQESMKNIVDYNYAINKSGEKIKIGHK